MTGVARARVTAGELPALSARLAARGRRAELVGGDLVTMTPAGGRHGQVAHTLALFLGIHVRERGLGRVFAAETGFVLQRDPDTVRVPDAAFVERRRLGPGGAPPGFVEGAPDLAAEVVSPSDSAAAVEEKVRGWLGAGARLVWVVDPEARSVVVHRRGRLPETLDDDAVLVGDPVLPDLRVPVRDLFA